MDLVLPGPTGTGSPPLTVMDVLPTGPTGGIGLGFVTVMDVLPPGPTGGTGLGFVPVMDVFPLGPITGLTVMDVFPASCAKAGIAKKDAIVIAIIF